MQNPKRTLRTKIRIVYIYNIDNFRRESRK
uniref:Uncharacterized protein n=1 Tax=Rhizophora mucronata TaxID=61149 RepID=A0A2P2NX92_RHIMU